MTRDIAALDRLNELMNINDFWDALIETFPNHVSKFVKDAFTFWNITDFVELFAFMLKVTYDMDDRESYLSGPFQVTIPKVGEQHVEKNENSPAAAAAPTRTRTTPKKTTQSKSKKASKKKHKQRSVRTVTTTPPSPSTAATTTTTMTVTLNLDAETRRVLPLIFQWCCTKQAQRYSSANTNRIGKRLGIMWAFSLDDVRSIDLESLPNIPYDELSSAWLRRSPSIKTTTATATITAADSTKTISSTNDSSPIVNHHHHHHHTIDLNEFCDVLIERFDVSDYVKDAFAYWKIDTFDDLFIYMLYLNTTMNHNKDHHNIDDKDHTYEHVDTKVGRVRSFADLKKSFVVHVDTTALNKLKKETTHYPWTSTSKQLSKTKKHKTSSSASSSESESESESDSLCSTLTFDLDPYTCRILTLVFQWCCAKQQQKQAPQAGPTSTATANAASYAYAFSLDDVRALDLPTLQRDVLLLLKGNNSTIPTNTNTNTLSNPSPPIPTASTTATATTNTTDSSKTTNTTTTTTKDTAHSSTTVSQPPQPQPQPQPPLCRVVPPLSPPTSLSLPPHTAPVVQAVQEGTVTPVVVPSTTTARSTSTSTITTTTTTKAAAAAESVSTNKSHKKIKRSNIKNMDNDVFAVLDEQMDLDDFWDVLIETFHISRNVKDAFAYWGVHSFSDLFVYMIIMLNSNSNANHSAGGTNNSRFSDLQRPFAMQHQVDKKNPSAFLDTHTRRVLALMFQWCSMKQAEQAVPQLAYGFSLDDVRALDLPTLQRYVKDYNKRSSSLLSSALRMGMSTRTSAQPPSLPPQQSPPPTRGTKTKVASTAVAVPVPVTPTGPTEIQSDPSLHLLKLHHPSQWPKYKKKLRICAENLGIQWLLLEEENEGKYDEDLHEDDRNRNNENDILFHILTATMDCPEALKEIVPFQQLKWGDGQKAYRALVRRFEPSPSSSPPLPLPETTQTQKKKEEDSRPRDHDDDNDGDGKMTAKAITATESTITESAIIESTITESTTSTQAAIVAKATATQKSSCLRMTEATKEHINGVFVCIGASPLIINLFIALGVECLMDVMNLNKSDLDKAFPVEVFGGRMTKVPVPTQNMIRTVQNWVNKTHKEGNWRPDSWNTLNKVAFTFYAETSSTAAITMFEMIQRLIELGASPLIRDFFGGGYNQFDIATIVMNVDPTEFLESFKGIKDGQVKMLPLQTRMIMETVQCWWDEQVDQGTLTRDVWNAFDKEAYQLYAEAGVTLTPGEQKALRHVMKNVLCFPKDAPVRIALQDKSVCTLDDLLECTEDSLAQLTTSIILTDKPEMPPSSIATKFIVPVSNAARKKLLDFIFWVEFIKFNMDKALNENGSWGSINFGHECPINLDDPYYHLMPFYLDKSNYLEMNRHEFDSFRWKLYFAAIAKEGRHPPPPPNQPLLPTFLAIEDIIEKLTQLQIPQHRLLKAAFKAWSVDDLMSFLDVLPEVTNCPFKVTEKDMKEEKGSVIRSGDTFLTIIPAVSSTMMHRLQAWLKDHIKQPSDILKSLSLDSSTATPTHSLAVQWQALDRATLFKWTRTTIPLTAAEDKECSKDNASLTGPPKPDVDKIVQSWKQQVIQAILHGGRVGGGNNNTSNSKVKSGGEGSKSSNSKSVKALPTTPLSDLLANHPLSLLQNVSCVVEQLIPYCISTKKMKNQNPQQDPQQEQREILTLWIAQIQPYTLVSKSVSSTTGRSVLHTLCYEGKAELLHKIKVMAPLISLTCLKGCSDSGWTCLQYACLSGSIATFELVLQYGTPDLAIIASSTTDSTLTWKRENPDKGFTVMELLECFLYLKPHKMETHGSAAEEIRNRLEGSALSSKCYEFTLHHVHDRMVQVIDVLKNPQKCQRLHRTPVQIQDDIAAIQAKVQRVAASSELVTKAETQNQQEKETPKNSDSPPHQHEQYNQQSTCSVQDEKKEGLPKPSIGHPLGGSNTQTTSSRSTSSSPSSASLTPDYYQGDIQSPDHKRAAQSWKQQVIQAILHCGGKNINKKGGKKESSPSTSSNCKSTSASTSASASASTRAIPPPLINLLANHPLILEDVDIYDCDEYVLKQLIPYCVSSKKMKNSYQQQDLQQEQREILTLWIAQTYPYVLTNTPASSATGRPVLHTLCYEGKAELLQKILPAILSRASRACYEMCCDSGWTYFHYACLSGSIATFELILQYIAPSFVVINSISTDPSLTWKCDCPNRGFSVQELLEYFLQLDRPLPSLPPPHKLETHGSATEEIRNRLKGSTSELSSRLDYAFTLQHVHDRVMQVIDFCKKNFYNLQQLPCPYHTAVEIEDDVAVIQAKVRRAVATAVEIDEKQQRQLIRSSQEKKEKDVSEIPAEFQHTVSLAEEEIDEKQQHQPIRFSEEEEEKDVLQPMMDQSPLLVDKIQERSVDELPKLQENYEIESSNRPLSVCCSENLVSEEPEDPLMPVLLGMGFAEEEIRNAIRAIGGGVNGCIAEDVITYMVGGNPSPSFDPDPTNPPIDTTPSSAHITSSLAPSMTEKRSKLNIHANNDKKQKVMAACKSDSNNVETLNAPSEAANLSKAVDSEREDHMTAIEKSDKGISERRCRSQEKKFLTPARHQQKVLTKKPSKVLSAGTVPVNSCTDRTLPSVNTHLLGGVPVPPQLLGGVPIPPQPQLLGGVPTPPPQLQPNGGVSTFPQLLGGVSTSPQLLGGVPSALPYDLKDSAADKFSEEKATIASSIDVAFISQDDATVSTLGSMQTSATPIIPTGSSLPPSMLPQHPQLTPPAFNQSSTLNHFKVQSNVPTSDSLFCTLSNPAIDHSSFEAEQPVPSLSTSTSSSKSSSSLLSFFSPEFATATLANPPPGFDLFPLRKGSSNSQSELTTLASNQPQQEKRVQLNCTLDQQQYLHPLKILNESRNSSPSIIDSVWDDYKNNVRPYGNSSLLFGDLFDDGDELAVGSATDLLSLAAALFATEPYSKQLTSALHPLQQSSLQTVVDEKDTEKVVASENLNNVPSIQEAAHPFW